MQGDTQNDITSIAAVIAAHTGLVLPTTAPALAACLLLPDAAFRARSKPQLADACVDHVLAHIVDHVPAINVTNVDRVELRRALVRLPAFG